MASQKTAKRLSPSNTGLEIASLELTEESLFQLSRPLLDWYRRVARPLPWRASRDPYKIWISEVMLQQTTVTAVVPYFERFIERFPHLAALAMAEEAQVLEQWSGLGYYSRARNLLRSARILHANGNGFPQSTQKMLELPGFGPYTARAVASIAFDEPVGVLDGNVIRVLTRQFGLAFAWWLPRVRQQLQEIVDRLVVGFPSGEVNQALMELGASLCRPKTPSCGLCPWHHRCVAFANGTAEDLPLKKPKRSTEVWVWQPEIHIKKNRAALVKNHYAPFLAGQWLWPGRAEKRSCAPKEYHFRHAITHHDIYIQMKRVKRLPKESHTWVELERLAQVSPTSLMKKTLKLLG